MDHHTPVSYTHLDVYKRQALNGCRIAEGCPPLGRPLFYEEGTEPVAGRFYLTEKALPEPYPAGCVILCGGAEAPADWGEATYICIPQAGQIAVFNDCLLYTSRCV